MDLQAFVLLYALSLLTAQAANVLVDSGFPMV